jgi:hypothetical protein
MRMESLQYVHDSFVVIQFLIDVVRFVKLSLQELDNVWRKRALAALADEARNNGQVRLRASIND